MARRTVLHARNRTEKISATLAQEERPPTALRVLREKVPANDGDLPMAAPMTGLRHDSGQIQPIPRTMAERDLTMTPSQRMRSRSVLHVPVNKMIYLSEQDVESFSDAESFCEALRADFRSKKAIDFHGTYTVPMDHLVSPKARTQMVATEIWKLSGYRFTVKDHHKLKNGHRTRFWCSQDETHKKPSKASQNPGVRNRDNPGMKRYPCGSKLSIVCRAVKDTDDVLVDVKLRHAGSHVSYVDVSMPPAALDMIREYVEWLTPGAMVTKVQATFPDISAAQIHRVWTEMSEVYWRRDDAQLLSAEILLSEHGDDVDVFKPEDVPEGVEMLCWGMKKIAEPLRGRIVEIGVDATYNTNSKHLELYSIMGEQDGAGFPLSYLLLSTASSIDQGKRTKALTAWAKCVRDTYGITARFTHVDKDMAEIGMLKDVWNAKISLCWWHLRRAVRTRLASAKLSTTPYDPGRAHEEFSFVDIAFVPQAQADGGEYEGGTHDNVTPVVPPTQQSRTITVPNGLRITIPARAPPADIGESGAPPSRTQSAPRPPLGTSRLPLAVVGQNGVVLPLLPSHMASADVDDAAGSLEKENVPEEAAEPVRSRAGRVLKPTRNVDAADPVILAQNLKARTAGPAVHKTKTKARRDVAGDVSGEEEEDEEDKPARRTFCPAVYRDRIVAMMEKHFCAHPLLPGYAMPTAEGIKRWAVSQIYQFCVEHGLREVWAYLWENWYRKSRWELWARSVNREIPVMKTTMMLESHWRRIKHDFLCHFHMPRCDLLAWIIVVKLAPSYYRKLDRLLTETGRYRELPCWRKDFKRVWRRLERTPITLPVNPAYRTDAKMMLCTCPHLATSRFLICKHTVQSVGRVPPVFFLEVKRRRTAPFWVHPTLRPLSDNGDVQNGDEASVLDDPAVPDFAESMDHHIDTIIEFATGLKFQRQFRDQRMLQALERDGGGFLRLATACLGKEKRLASTRGGVTPSTWDRSTGSAMFYRARPACSDGST
ncbi:hypothetical protein B0H10DRAFT_2073246 [Mycena sp. CBHHK59/15]|nr:hypothetical protein B0H10DRAFT_2073246 [Mycena sp. CBHHK59/15]